MADEPNGEYYKRGLHVPETPAAEGEVRAWRRTGVVGRPIPRVDGYERVSGTAVYPSDVLLPKMLYGAILRCPHPHARVRSIDVSAAERAPGVRAVLTDRSPEASVEWSYAKGMKARLFDPLCRFEGETVAAVAAETPYQAWDAARLIRVEYEVLPFSVDERRAVEANAPKVHEQGNAPKPETYGRGDVEAGFAGADVVVEREYRTECELHTPLELHGCVANWEGDALTLWESTQGVYAVQAQVAKTLGLPLAKVRVIGHYVGGGFGSKLQSDKYAIIAALLAKRTARPVKLFLTREETFLAVGNRPPSNMTVKVGATKEGSLTALEFVATATGGAYPAGGTSLLDWLVRDLYLCPNVRTETTDVFTHCGPARPFRAPGHPQCAWALEQALDELAEKLGLDAVELRLRNLARTSQALGRPYTSNGLEECLRKGAEAFGWAEARLRLAGSRGTGRFRRGVGMASCLWFVGGGGPPSTVVLKLFSDGSVNLNMGASDIGTGTKTVMAAVVAEELGVRVDAIQIENADTGTTQFATPSGGSKTVPTEAPTVRAAALDVKRQLLAMAAQELKVELSTLRFGAEEILSADDPAKKLPIRDLDGLKRRGLVVGVGYRGPNPAGKVINPFAAQFCEVEVDLATGEVKLLRFLSANESGRVMNRLTFDSQVIGGIAMGVGLGMTEFRQLDLEQTGKMVNRNWHDYKLPTALDVPLRIDSLPVELPDPEANSVGAKGLGEPVTIPTAAAIANAVYHATGVRVTGSPINPLNLAAALARQQGGG